MSELFDNVKPGARVHYLDRHGKTASGTVVINKGTHLVLNTGGRHGTPKVVTPDNYVKHSEGGKVVGARLSNLAKSMKGETSVNEEGEQLDAYKSALAYETKHRIKKKKHTKATKSAVKEAAEYAPDGQGKYKVNYIHPDKSKKENDRFETRNKAEKYASDLKSKGYHDVHIGEETTSEILARVKKGDERSKQVLAQIKKDSERRKYEIHGPSSRSGGVARRGTGKPLGTLGIGEGFDARETEHSGAKKGKGAYYGRKKDAKKESNKARREADKKSCCTEARADGEVQSIRSRPDGEVQSIRSRPDGEVLKRVKDVARKEIIKKIHSAEKDEKSKHGGWTGMREAHYRDNPSIKFLVHKLDRGALVMTDRGDVHDHYDSHEEARKAADKLNNDYGVRRWNKKRAEKEAVKEERIDEIGPFNISKHPLGAKVLKTVDKVLDKVQDHADARYQKKQDKIAKERFGKSWTEAGMKAPRKIDPQHQQYPNNVKEETNFHNRLDEVSKELLLRYVRKASRQAADNQYSAGHAYGSTMQAHKSAAKLQHGRPMKFAGKRRELAYDAADKAEAPHMEKSRKRLKGIDKATSKLVDDPRYAVVPATNEGRESEYRANMQLAGTSRRKPGHYLVRNGSTVSGPHEPHDALRKYKGMDDTSGVKIVHIKEAANTDKAKQAVKKAIFSAKSKKKGKTAHVEPELEIPGASTSQPMLQGPEGADNARV